VSEVLLKEKKRDLKVQEAAFCEELEKSSCTQDDRALLSELADLRDSLTEVQVDRVSEAEELVTLGTRMSSALMDMRMELVRYIPKVPNRAQEVLEVVDTMVGWLHEMLGIVTEAWTQEVNSLVSMMVNHLIAYY
jgi:ElaB/YqjD/DUF883 family membrane-anchored ribosome-binding protein